MPGVQGFEIIVGEDFRRAAAQLGAEDKVLPREIHSAINDAAKFMARMAADRVLTVDLPGGPEPGTGLRRRVSRGVTVTDIPEGAMIDVRMKDPDEWVIPEGMDTSWGWTHPVFGHMTVWVRQPGSSWFMGTMRENIPYAEKKVKDALDASISRIANTS